jgi:hypothetical protein
MFDLLLTTKEEMLHTYIYTIAQEFQQRQLIDILVFSVLTEDNQQLVYQTVLRLTTIL